MKLKIKSMFKAWIEKCSNERRKEVIERVNRSVQLREFEGKIWFCYDNIPLIEQEQLKMDICDTIKDARDTVCRYFKL